MDKVFEEEQKHLSATYAKLERIESELQAELSRLLGSVLEDKDVMLDELGLDSQADVHVETMAEYEAINRIIDTYNIAADATTERLHRVQLLLKQPYFAKVTLQFKPGAKPKDIYIGNAGMADDGYRHFIIDWRSPIAEVYYNQENGHTSYMANDRKIECDLQLRRQFDIEKDKLNAYFDTTVAIQDALLLASLSKERSSKLTAITATIQKEQNAIIRHEDVPVLLVSGIAGSGKTSVLLQRIAYLFYRQRETLQSQDVFLITPNPVFQQYIENVLPEMGESNPSSITYDALMEQLGLGSRSLGGDIDVSDLIAIEEKLPAFRLRPNDFQDIRIDNEPVITAIQASSAWNKHKKLESGTHRSSLVIDDLIERLSQRIKRLAKSEKYQDLLNDLSEEEQLACFGEYVFAGDMDESELTEYTEKLLTWRYRDVENMIENGNWLRIDAIGMRLLEKQTLSAVEWLYLKLALVGTSNRRARYVLIDEVQDYTAAQLMCLARYFNNAHFLLLGDENQAISPGTASFGEIRDVFTRMRGHVEECELMTSYRSSPEITELFTSLLDPETRIHTSSVQRPGIDPTIIECKDTAQYERSLREIVTQTAEQDCLAAIIAPDAKRMNQLERQLEGLPVIIPARTDSMPDKGTLLLDISLAKGLEFDQVIVPDVQDRAYPDSKIAKNRLYTAISRATQKVTLIANGPLTKLIAR